MSRLSHCWLVTIVTIACYSACGHTTDKDCQEEVSAKILFYHSVGHKAPTSFNPRVDKDVAGLTLGTDEVVIITHGYLENSYHPSCELIRRAYLLTESMVHVIVVDWSFATKGLLSSARKKMAAVGQEIADLIKKMGDSVLPQITLVGHSLGAHVMGIVGKNLGGTIPIIIALDPTFITLVKPDELRLSKSAAKNVQVIHAYSYGESKALGHVDFYANGPQNRPSCPCGRCTHGHAYEYFAESLTSQLAFKAKKCTTDDKPSRSCKVGEEVDVGGRTPDSNLTGKFYFETNAESPYIIREPCPNADSLTTKILRMRNNVFTSMRSAWQTVFGK